jgi:hypothetical protein
MKNNYNRICIISLVAAIFFAGSCSVDNGMDDGNPDIDYVMVYGGVYDKENMQTLDSIMVVMTSYSSYDRTKVVGRDTVYTQDGAYTFVIYAYSKSMAYDISATDIDGERNGGKYFPGKITLFVSDDSPLYSASSKLYYITDQNFYLKKSW